jgi:aryl-alcohol dehydrogenase-like predicted oxidoreductase
MKTVRLGRTGFKVSVAGLGTGGHSRVGLRQGKSFDESVALVRTALDLGVNLVDTAAAYGTEEIVGAAVRRRRRDGVVLSTKEQIHEAGSDAGGTELIDGAELVLRVEASLARLTVDHVDILHLHAVCTHQYDYCRHELVPALLRLREAGKIRFLGITECFASETGHAMLERALEDDVWDVLMVGYNLVNQTARHRVLPTARERDLAVCACSRCGKRSSARTPRACSSSGWSMAARSIPRRSTRPIRWASSSPRGWPVAARGGLPLLPSQPGHRRGAHRHRQPASPGGEHPRDRRPAPAPSGGRAAASHLPQRQLRLGPASSGDSRDRATAYIVALLAEEQELRPQFPRFDAETAWQPNS